MLPDFYLEKSFFKRACIFLHKFLSIPASKIIYNTKSTEYCDFYCGPQPVAKEKL